jgi:hypothetical protein
LESFKKAVNEYKLNSAKVVFWNAMHPSLHNWLLRFRWEVSPSPSSIRDESDKVLQNVGNAMQQYIPDDKKPHLHCRKNLRTHNCQTQLIMLAVQIQLHISAVDKPSSRYV